MTRFLASVTDLAEARVALADGADLIDFKDPRRGALGALPVAVVAECVAALRGARETGDGPTRATFSPLPWRERGRGEGDRAQGASDVATSATVGDLPPDPALLVGAVAEMAATGVTYVKLGFFGRGIAPDCLEALAPLARCHRLVAVLFADLEPDLSAVVPLARAGFAGVMLDTAGKDGRGLRDCMAQEDIARFVAAARAEGLLTGLAGSLKASDIPALLSLSPDYLGFRGALCVGSNRTAKLDPAALREVRARIPLRNAVAA